MYESVCFSAKHFEYRINFDIKSIRITCSIPQKAAESLALLRLMPAMGVHQQQGTSHELSQVNEHTKRTYTHKNMMPNTGKTKIT